MALIESLTNINKIGDNYYEVVNGAVSIGAGIDDVSDSIFIMKDGGLLKYTTGCTTTFTRCQFIETETALALGVDNFRSYQPGYPPRFNGTCAPVFKGCSFVCNTSARSDFDADVNAGMTFTYDEDGVPCRIVVRNEAFAQYNHLASDKQIINGLIVDQNGAGAALEFAAIPSDPTQWSNLKVVNYDGTSSARHVTMLFYGTAGNEYTVSRLDCRNLALYGGTGTLRAVDPIGRLLKTDDTTSSDDGRLEVYRTYGADFIDAVTGLSKHSRSSYYTSNGVYSNDFGVTYKSELIQYSQDNDTVVVVNEPDYTEVIQSYGYYAQTKTFTLADETNPLENIKKAFVFKDSEITEPDYSVVRTYSSITDLNMLYDSSRWFDFLSNDPTVMGTDTIKSSGTVLELGSKDLVVDPTLKDTYGFTNNSVAITGTPSNELFVSGVKVYDELATTDTIFSNADFQSAVSATANYQLNSFQFSSDGTKLFAFGTASSADNANVLLEYTLSVAWDRTTATLTNTLASGYINGQQGYGRIVDNGTKVIWSKRWGTWYAWDLGTAWDLSTAGARQDIAFVARRTGFDFNHDGTKLYTSRDANDTTQCYIYEYTLSTPYDVSTASGQIETNLGLISLQTGTLFNVQRTVKWFDGGNYLAYNDPVYNNVYFYKATTAYDSTSLTLIYTLDGTHPYSGNGTSFTGIEFAEKIDKMFLSQANDDSGVYPLDVYDMYQNIDFNGSSNTIYINSSALSGTSQFDLVRTTGYVTAINGATIGCSIQDANGTLTTVSINGINPDTEVRMYRASDDTEIAGLESSVGDSATLNYNFTSAEETYIIVHNVNYRTSPNRINFTTQGTAATLTVFQQLDRAYNNS